MRAPVARSPVATDLAFPLQGAKPAEVAAFVDRTLWRSGLTVAMIAAGVGISRSVLYRHSPRSAASLASSAIGASPRCTAP